MEKMRFLIIDSDAEKRNYLKFALERSYRDVDIDDSADYTDGVMKLEEKHYDLIILNLTESELKPMDIIKLARKRQGAYKVYILVIAHKDDKESFIAALQKGADGYITIPYTAEGVLKKLAEFDDRFDRREFARQGALGSLTFIFGDNSVAAEIIDISYGGVLVNLSNKFPMPQILEKIQVSFTTPLCPEGRLDVEALVIRIQATDITLISDKVRFALKFTETDPSKKAALKDVVEDIKLRV